MGRMIADVLGSSANGISRQEVEKVLSASQQDALLVLYLSNLVQTQMALADKLGTAYCPITL